MSPLRLFWGLAFFIGAAWLVMAAGCQTLEQRAPLVDERTLAVGTRHGIPSPTLIRGRDVYIVHCGGCHAVRSVAGHSPAEWERILSRMAPRAKLSREQANDVIAYVLTTRQALATPSTQSK